MEGGQQIKFADLCERSAQLIERSRSTLEELNVDVSGIPDSAFDEGRPLSIVFAGQYSAGKSTIVKALTGADEVKIGRGITTEEATPYDWCGIHLVDTPGIASGLRPDHDEISRAAITDAEILVYVVTYEGFDSVVAGEFRKLIIDEDKAACTVLVVNKMANSNLGNTPQQREIVAGDLAKVTAPYTPDQLRATFVDAKSYLRALELGEENPGRAQRLLSRSGMRGLFDTLGALASDSQLSARLSRPLYLTVDALSDAKAELAGDDGQSATGVLREQLMRERHALSNTISDIELGVRSIGLGTASEVRGLGHEYAERIPECASESEAQGLIDEMYDHLEDILNKHNSEVQELIRNRVEKYESDLNDFRVTFERNLGQDMGWDQGSIPEEVKNLFTTTNMDKFVSVVDKFTVADESANGLKKYAASKVHLFLRDMLKRMNIRTGPWGVVKITRGINVASKVLGAAGAFFGVGMQAKEDMDAYAREEQRRNLRSAIVAEFNDHARELENQTVANLDELLDHDENFRPKLVQIRSLLAAIDLEDQKRGVGTQKLNGLIDECGSLIKEIHRTL